jgi:hypothetical protein
MKEAPLFVDAYDLALDLCRLLGSPSTDGEHRCCGELGKRVSATALDLLERITLTLKGYDQEDNAEQADERLAVLRVHLRLAMDLGLIERQRHLALIELLDAIGRQLGGWLKRLREV